jgi:hypothetical protein
MLPVSSLSLLFWQAVKASRVITNTPKRESLMISKDYVGFTKLLKTPTKQPVDDKIRVSFLLTRLPGDYCKETTEW